MAAVAAAVAATPFDLPEGYTPVEYIESSGLERIDTGVVSDTNLVASLDFVPLAYSGTEAFYLGTTNGADGARWRLGAAAADRFARFGYAGAECSGMQLLALRNRYTVRCSVSEGVAVIELKSPLDSSAGYDRLACEPDDGELSVFTGVAMRLYGLVFWRAQAVERYFLPAVRDSDAALGLYDLVGRRFYANAGEGCFTCGDLATLSVDDCRHLSIAVTWGDGAVTNEIVGGSVQLPVGADRVKVLFTPERRYRLEPDTPVVELPGMLTGDYRVGTDCPQPHAVNTGGDLGYLDWDPVSRTLTNAVLKAADYDYLTSDGTPEDGRWSVVAEDLAVSDLVITGDVRMLLLDGCTLTATGGEPALGRSASAVVIGRGGSLTIYGQSGGTGAIVAESLLGGAGFGGSTPSEPAGALTINGGAIRAAGPSGTLAASAAAPVSVRAGVFAAGVLTNGAWIAEGCVQGANDAPLTRADYPVTVGAACRVTLVGDRSRLGVGWSTPDGLVSNAVAESSFVVPAGYDGLVLAFSPVSCYRLADGAAPTVVIGGPVVTDVTVDVPAAVPLEGSELAPWRVGEDVYATTNGVGGLVVTGTGATFDFTAEAPTPWTGLPVTTVSLPDPVAPGKRFLAGLANSVTVEGVSLRLLKALVSESDAPERVGSLGPVRFTSITCSDGSARLGVAVRMKGAASGAAWADATVESAAVDASTGAALVTVTAPADEGYLDLESGEASE